MTSFWRSGTDYDIESESKQLRDFGEPFLLDFINSGNLNADKPLAVDFGCWSGRHLRLLERVADGGKVKSEFAKKRVIGIDEPFAKERLDQARRAYHGFQLFDDGISSTGLPSSSVDFAISWRVLHNLTNPGEWTNVMAEIARVMKHDAPLIVSVRATRDWMNQDAPMPQLHRTYSYGIDRDDLYFSEKACYAMFKFYGFDTPFKAERFGEEEIVNGIRVKNDYWMLALVCNKRSEPTTYSELLAGSLKLSDIPKRKLTRTYK